MLDVVPNVALPVFAFYLLVACNYVKEIFGCGLQNVLDNSIFAKHAVAFILLFFLVVAVNPELADQKLAQNFALSVGIYIWFIITTRTPFYIMLMVVVLLLASYIASIAKSRHAKNLAESNPKPSDSAGAEMQARHDTAKAWQYGLAYAALGISIVGFIIYFIEKRREYGSSFTLAKFFSGNLKCRGYTPASVKLVGRSVPRS